MWQQINASEKVTGTVDIKSLHNPDKMPGF